jgi:dephospho-CoA kinase
MNFNGAEFAPIRRPKIPMGKRRKIKIAVTGGIGSGKSTFCKYLSELGVRVINVDDVSKELLENDSEIRKDVIKAFGTQSYNGQKANKKYLAEKVFNNPENVLKINSIIHPKVIKKVNILADEILKHNDIAAAEAALIYEADMESYFDFVVLVTAEKDVRMNRKMALESYSKDQFDRRNENQIPDSEKRKRADFIFENNDGLAELKGKAFLLKNILTGLSTGNV